MAGAAIGTAGVWKMVVAFHSFKCRNLGRLLIYCHRFVVASFGKEKSTKQGFLTFVSYIEKTPGLANFP